MIDEPFRRAFARVSAGPVALLRRAGVSANQVTVLAFVLGVLAAASTTTGSLKLGLALWAASRLCDAFDGLLARGTSGPTHFGGFLDISLDMLAYALMACAFAIAMPTDQRLWGLVLVGYIMAITTTLALSSLLERADRQLGGDRSLQFSAGVAEGGETFIVYAIIALAPQWSRPVLYIWIAALTVTTVQRFAFAQRVLR